MQLAVACTNNMRVRSHEQHLLSRRPAGLQLAAPCVGLCRGHLQNTARPKLRNPQTSMTLYLGVHRRPFGRASHVAGMHLGVRGSSLFGCPAPPAAASGFCPVPGLVLADCNAPSSRTPPYQHLHRVTHASTHDPQLPHDSKHPGSSSPTQGCSKAHLGCVHKSLSLPQHDPAPAINTRPGCGWGQAALNGLLVPLPVTSAVQWWSCLSAWKWGVGCRTLRAAEAVEPSTAVLQNHGLFVVCVGWAEACVRAWAYSTQAQPPAVCRSSYRAITM